MRRFLTNDVRLRQYKMHMFRRISACWSLTDSFMYIYDKLWYKNHEPRSEKTCLRGF